MTPTRDVDRVETLGDDALQPLSAGRLEQRDDLLRQQLHRERLALQRQRSPAALLDRVKDVRLSEPAAEEANPARDARRP